MTICRCVMKRLHMIISIQFSNQLKMCVLVLMEHNTVHKPYFYCCFLSLFLMPVLWVYNDHYLTTMIRNVQVYFFSFLERHGFVAVLGRTIDVQLLTLLHSQATRHLYPS